MSARDEVFQWMDRSCAGETEREEAAALLDAYRDEVRREMARDLLDRDTDPYLDSHELMGVWYAALQQITEPEENRS